MNFTEAFHQSSQFHLIFTTSANNGSGGFQRSSRRMDVPVLDGGWKPPLLGANLPSGLLSLIE